MRFELRYAVAFFVSAALIAIAPSLALARAVPGVRAHAPKPNHPARKAAAKQTGPLLPSPLAPKGFLPHGTDLEVINRLWHARGDFEKTRPRFVTRERTRRLLEACVAGTHEAPKLIGSDLALTILELEEGLREFESLYFAPLLYASLCQMPRVSIKVRTDSVARLKRAVAVAIHQTMRDYFQSAISEGYLPFIDQAVADQLAKVLAQEIDNYSSDELSDESVSDWYWIAVTDYHRA